jgi:hypothetical protein
LLRDADTLRGTASQKHACNGSSRSRCRSVAQAIAPDHRKLSPPTAWVRHSFFDRQALRVARHDLLSRHRVPRPGPDKGGHLEQFKTDGGDTPGLNRHYRPGVRPVIEIDPTDLKDCLSRKGTSPSRQAVNCVAKT